ncbi:hypothetical protein BDV39DRAFT_181579 [Aspergillus sergii]|uniref:Uncharacterized protein n=1 Tax=Aspergillus sergii TaxID=1034303 RepID=A0A5N6WSM8_9EURO|nr:hypothetical protein BDV39DRAFT_181579 [Aspergillus sergii]
MVSSVEASGSYLDRVSSLWFRLIDFIIVCSTEIILEGISFLILAQLCRSKKHTRIENTRWKSVLGLNYGIRRPPMHGIQMSQKSFQMRLSKL